MGALILTAAWQSSLWLCAGWALVQLTRERPARAYFSAYLCALGALVSPVLLVVLAVVDSSNSNLTISGLTRAAGVVWICVSLVAAVGLMVSIRRAARVLRDAVPYVDPTLYAYLADLGKTVGLTGAPTVFATHALPCPVAWGWRLHPTLLLPVNADSGESGWARNVLLHELIHLRRSDHLSLLIFDLLVCVFAWNPLAWTLRRTARHLCEHACDDAVLSYDASPQDYARELLQFGSVRHHFMPGGVSNAGLLRRRIERIVDTRAHRDGLTARWSLLAMTCFVATVAAMGWSGAQQSGSAPAQGDALADVREVVSEEHHTEGDRHRRYFLMPATESDEPLPLLVILPGGDGGADFNPFLRRVALHSLNHSVHVAQLVAPEWSSGQFNEVVWPIAVTPWPQAQFTTEEFIASVIRDTAAHVQIDPKRVYVMGWSSGGPPAYAALLSLPEVRGAIVAMSIFRLDWTEHYPTNGAKRVAVLHSNDDRVVPYSFGAQAVDELRKRDFEANMFAYAGGHGWRGDVYGLIERAFRYVDAPHLADDTTN